jgi:hypothetical protein
LEVTPLERTMMKVQLAVGAAVALLAFAAVPQAHADVYDYGYGPVYGGYSVSNGACPNGQCSGSYSPIYSATYPVYSAQSYGPQTCPSGSVLERWLPKWTLRNVSER